MKKDLLGKIIFSLLVLVFFAALAYFFYFRNLVNLPSNPYKQNSSYSWQAGKTSPFASTDGAGTLWNDKLYIAGGFGDLAITLNQIAAYDPETNAWQDLPPFPQPRNHAMLVGVGDQLLLIGGYDGGSAAKKEVFSYNSTTNSWVQKKSLPIGIGAATVVEFAGYVYLFGGVREDTKLSREVLRYDPVFDTWSSISEIPTLREHLASAVLNGEIYVIAGRTAGFDTNLSIVEIFDPVKRTWRLGPSLDIARGGLTAASAAGTVFVFGGERNEGTISEVEKLNLLNNEWEVVSQMPNPRHGLASGATTKGISVINGGKRPGLSISSVNDLMLLPEQ